MRDEVVNENLRWGAEQRKQAQDFQHLARKQWNRLRETVWQRDFDAWLDYIADRLGRARETVRLLSTAETYALQDVTLEASFLWRTGQMPGFEREVPAEQSVEVYRLLDKLAACLPDIQVHLLCGADVLWLRHGEPERWEVWGNGSGYFGAVEATSAEVLTSAPAWLDRHDDVIIKMVNSINRLNSLTLFWGRDHRGTFCIMQLVGPQWGLLLADERSGWTYEGWLEETIRRRTQRGGETK